MSELPFREAARATADLVADYLAAVPKGPVWQPMEPAARARLLDAPLPAPDGRWRSCWRASRPR